MLWTVNRSPLEGDGSRLDGLLEIPTLRLPPRLPAGFVAGAVAGAAAGLAASVGFAASAGLAGAAAAGALVAAAGLAASAGLAAGADAGDWQAVNKARPERPARPARWSAERRVRRRAMTGAPAVPVTVGRSWYVSGAIGSSSLGLVRRAGA